MNSKGVEQFSFEDAVHMVLSEENLCFALEQHFVGLAANVARRCGVERLDGLMDALKGTLRIISLPLSVESPQVMHAQLERIAHAVQDAQSKMRTRPSMHVMHPAERGFPVRSMDMTVPLTAGFQNGLAPAASASTTTI